MTREDQRMAALNSLTIINLALWVGIAIYAVALRVLHYVG